MRLARYDCASCLILEPPSAAAPKPDPGMLAAMHKYVNINPEEFPAAMVERLQLQRLLPLAIDRAIFENLPALSERASSVACNTTAELILKVLPRRDGSHHSPSMQRALLPSRAPSCQLPNVFVQPISPCGVVPHIAGPAGRTMPHPEGRPSWSELHMLTFQEEKSICGWLGL